MTSAAASGVAPMAAPPLLTFGHDMLISKPDANGASSSKSSSARTYSSMEWPATWQMTRQPRSSSPARYSP